MILVTGANGQTGRAIIKALLAKGEQVRALVRRPEQIEALKVLGPIEVVVGDMLEQSSVDKAYTGVDKVYHICSAINPKEVEIGEIALKAAHKAKIKHFVYHSVLHSVLQDMPHHQKKLIVEALVINSGIPYTIIKPAVFMQNTLESWKALTEENVFRQKFFTNDLTRICMVDLDDLAEAVSIILTTPNYTGASFELSGSENLSLSDMVSIIEKHFNTKIKVETPADDVFSAQLKKFGAEAYTINTLLKMFHHYNEYGFVGNSKVLTWILGREPKDFSAFIARTLKERS